MEIKDIRVSFYINEVGIGFNRVKKEGRLVQVYSSPKYVLNTGNAYSVQSVAMALVLVEEENHFEEVEVSSLIYIKN